MCLIVTVSAHPELVFECVCHSSPYTHTHTHTHTQPDLSCSADTKGSKIVPIAVGAALAGLVIIVLIAYIIGRLRSRKQGSYEALS